MITSKNYTIGQMKTFACQMIIRRKKPTFYLEKMILQSLESRAKIIHKNEIEMLENSNVIFLDSNHLLELLHFLSISSEFCIFRWLREFPHVSYEFFLTGISILLCYGLLEKIESYSYDTQQIFHMLEGIHKIPKCGK